MHVVAHPIWRATESLGLSINLIDVQISSYCGDGVRISKAQTIRVEGMC